MTVPELGSSIADLLRLGNRQLEVGRREDAWRIFSLALERVPGHPEALMGRARAGVDPSAALSLTREALQGRPAGLEAALATLEVEGDADQTADDVGSRVVSARDHVAARRSVLTGMPQPRHRKNAWNADPTVGFVTPSTSAYW